jgi:hypothetical protein
LKGSPAATQRVSAQRALRGTRAPLPPCALSARAVDAARSPAANAVAAARFLYWSISLVISTLSACALASLVWLGCKPVVRPLLTSPAVLTFFPILLGDFLFIGTYLPYHFANVLMSLAGQDAETRASDTARILDSTDTWCEYQTAGAVISLHMQFFGLLLLGYSPYRIMVDTEHRRRSRGLRASNVLLVISVACLVGICQVIILFWRENKGSYRGLYCGAARWDQIETGGWLVAELSLAYVLAVTFFCKAAAMLASGHLSAARDPVEAKQHEQQVWAIMRVGILVILSFTVTWMPYNIATVMNIAGGEPPVALDMIAGWMAKVKPAADVILIHHLPVMVTIQQRIHRAKRRATLAHRRVRVSHHHSSHRMLQPIQCATFTKREKRLLERAAAAKAEQDARHKSCGVAPRLPEVPNVPVVPSVPDAAQRGRTLEHIRHEVEQEEGELLVVSSSLATHTNAVRWTSLASWVQMKHILSELRDNAAEVEEEEEDLDEKEDARSHRPIKPRYLLDFGEAESSAGLGSDVLYLGGGKVVHLRDIGSGQATSSGSGQTASRACKQKASISSSSDEDDDDEEAELQAARRRQAARAKKSRP